jgi:hypothetical protein
LGNSDGLNHWPPRPIKVVFLLGAPLACGLQNTWIVLAANAGGWIENTMIRNYDNYFSFDYEKKGIPIVILGLWWWLEMWKVDKRWGSKILILHLG